MAPNVSNPTSEKVSTPSVHAVDDPTDLEFLVGNAKDFGIDLAEAPIQPDTQSITVEFKTPPGDEFASSDANAVIVGAEPEVADGLKQAIKVASAPGGNTTWTIDWPKLKKAGVSSLLTALTPAGAASAAPKGPVPMQYVQFGNPGSLPADFDASKPGIARVRSVTGGEAANFTAAGGWTADMVIDNNYTDQTFALGAVVGARTTRIADFESRFVVVQRNAAGDTLLKSTVGHWVGDIARVDKNTVIGLRDRTGEFVAGTTRPLVDVVQPETNLSTAGPLRSPVDIEPNPVPANASFVVTTAPRESDVAAYAAVKGRPLEIAKKHIKVILKIGGKVVKTGIVADGPIKYEGHAGEKGTVSASTMLEPVDENLVPAELQDYVDRFLKSTSAARAKFSDAVAEGLERNVKSRFSTATSRGD